MDLDKIYYNVEGDERNILQMVKEEPEWAANIIQTYESRLTLIQDLAIGYDGFDTVEGLKSLIDDIVKASEGELQEIGE